MQNHYKSFIFSFFGLQPKILHFMLEMYLYSRIWTHCNTSGFFLNGSYVHVYKYEKWCFQNQLNKWYEWLFCLKGWLHTAAISYVLVFVFCLLFKCEEPCGGRTQDHVRKDFLSVEKKAVILIGENILWLLMLVEKLKVVLFFPIPFCEKMKIF